MFPHNLAAQTKDTTTEVPAPEEEITEKNLKSVIAREFGLTGDLLQDITDIVEAVFNDPRSEVKTSEDRRVYMKLVKALLASDDSRVKLVEEDESAINFMAEAEKLVDTHNQLKQ